MKVHNVIDTLKIGENTSIIIDDNGMDIKNGIGILDERGKPYIILSVGMNKSNGEMKTTSLLIEGNFDSKRIYI